MDKRKLKLFTANSGFLSAKLEHEDGSTIHLHSLVKPEDESVYYENIEIWGDTIVFLGTGLGYHLVKVVPKIPPTTGIIVIDFYKELTDLFVKNFLNAIPNKFVVISGNDVDGGKILEINCRNSRLIQIVKHPASYQANKSFYDNLFLTTSKKRNRDGSFILLYGNFFLQEELKRAAVSIGIKPLAIPYEKLVNPLEYESVLSRLIQEENPSFILSVNMLGFDGNGLLGDLSKKFNLPVAIWFVDDPHPILLHQKRYIPEKAASFCWERRYLPFLKRQGFSIAEYLPLATDQEIFSPDKKCKYLTSLAFVGSSMGKKFLSEIADKFLWSEPIERFAVVCAETLLKQPLTPIDELIQSVCVKSGINIPFADERNFTWMCSYCIHIASMLRRKEMLTTLIPLNVETFGDPGGWRELCGMAVKTNPDIDYRTQLAQVYTGIDVNVNITSCQMKTAVNQRVFDIPACNGFVISDYQDDIYWLFDENEVAVYHDNEELKDLVAYFTKNEKQRNIITSAARSRILGEHTYAHRLETIIKKVRSI